VTDVNQSDPKPFDPFDALTERWSAVTAIHNVQLVDVQPGEGGFTRLVIEHSGRSRELVGGGRWSPEWSRQDIGKHGYVVPVKPFPESAQQPPEGACYFRAYSEPSLRRVPELDDSKGNLGWLCDGAFARGFLAPAHIIPGKGGRYIDDKTETVTVRVPPEFVRECQRVQLTPQQLLEGFIGDAAGIQNFVECPRADGFGSNGSDEREMADAWIQRAYGMNAVDLDALEAEREDREQREMEREDFGGLLEEFIDSGGQADELFKAVQALVDQQRDKNDR
jgi:hypothetical protein